MNGGKSLRINGDWIQRYFTFDEYGALHPREDALNTNEVAERIESLIHGDKNLGRELKRRVFSTDVEFSDRHIGSSPVIGYGVPVIGTSPLRKLTFEGRLSGLQGDRDGANFIKRCDKRERRIENYVKEAYDFVNSITPRDESEEVLKSIELDQALTGGGYDNTEMWGVSASLFHQLGGAVPEISACENKELARILMEEIAGFKGRFAKDCGIAQGSLHIHGFDMVRLFQESDGMIGFPIFAKSSKVLTKDIARRISMWSGVDCRHLVDSDVKGETMQGSEIRKAQVVDAMTFVLDKMIANPMDPTFANIIWTLARIQRHGYKMEDGKMIAKDGKSRSVSPGAAFSAGPEAMTWDDLLDKMKTGECSWMPSLQKREVADQLIWDWYEKTLVPNDMRALPLDWSKWDHHIYGWILATILYYVLRPLYDFESQKWVDFAIVSLVYKFFFVAEEATQALPEAWAKVQEVNAGHIAKIDGWYIVGTYDYLGSGAKLTHVGGSLYGELLIHHCIPRILGYEGVDGPQAGDDTAVGVPISMIDITDKEATFKPIVDAAAIFGLEMNAGKQIWAVGAGEVTNIFLQYAYNYNCKIKGIGTGARYYTAMPFAERDKGLSIGEQYMAILSKINNGYNNPWIRDYIRMWLEKDSYGLALFHYKGVQAFDILVASIGDDIIEATKRLELTYNWGLTQEQLQKGDIPVLPIIAEVAAGMSPTLSLDQALEQLKLQNDSPETTEESMVEDDVSDAAEE